MKRGVLNMQLAIEPNYGKRKRIMTGLYKSTNFKENDFIDVLSPCLNDLTKKFETQLYQDGFKFIRPIDDR